MASNILGIPVEETDIYIDDLASSDEIFCTGTAVVVSPVGKLKFGENIFQINQNQMGPITKKIRETILAIQREELDDSFGWLFKLENNN